MDFILALNINLFGMNYTRTVVELLVETEILVFELLVSFPFFFGRVCSFFLFKLESSYDTQIHNEDTSLPLPLGLNFVHRVFVSLE